MQNRQRFDDFKNPTDEQQAEDHGKLVQEGHAISRLTSSTNSTSTVMAAASRIGSSRSLYLLPDFPEFHDGIHLCREIRFNPESVRSNSGRALMLNF